MDYYHFTGELSVEGENCQFIFDNYKLVIELRDHRNIISFSKLKELPFETLTGTIATEPNLVLFFFNRTAYGYNFIQKGFSSFNLIIHVDYYCVLNKPFNGEQIKIQFNNNSFEKMTGVYPQFHNDDPFKVPNKVSILDKNINCSSSFIYKGLKYKVNPFYTLNSSQTHFDFTSTIEVECYDMMNYLSIYDLCQLFVKVLRFIYYRYYVSLGLVSIKNKVILEGETYYDEVGKFYFRYDEKEIEKINLDNVFDYGFIKWIDFYKHLPSLIDLIENNRIYLYHLPEKRKERFRTDYASISTVSAAFECEFSRCFDKYETLKKKDKNYLDLKEKLRKLDINKSQKSIVKNIIGNYLESTSLCEKAEYAFAYFTKVLEIFSLDAELTTKNAVKIFRDVRNKIDHGDLNLLIDNDTANVFYYMRIIVLCMQLITIGVPMENIDSIIRPVLGIDYNK